MPNVPSGVFQSVFFAIEQFDQAIRDHGVQLVHFRALPCPVGRIDKDDTTRRPHEDHFGCSGGMILKKSGVVKGLFSGNNTNYSFTDPGILETSNGSITVPRFYEGTETLCKVVPLDRFYLDDDAVTVTHWQLNEYRDDWAVDPLKFPATSVQDLVDSQGIEYKEGEDFQIFQGGIKWLARNPGVDPTTQRGRVYSIRFFYKPYFIVDVNPHEIRVVTEPDPVTGEIKSVLMPQLLSVRRENIFRDQDDDPLSIHPDPKREKLPPRRPIFGPR
jgi:hypothetical protein